MIEAWGRGIPRITEFCRDAGNPPPTWEVQPGGILRVRFPFSDACQAADPVARTPGTSRKDAGSSGSFRTPPETQKKSRKHPENTDTSQSLADRIVAFLRENPSASRRELVKGLQDATEGSVKYQMSKLKRLGELRRIGPDRGGRWMVVDGSETVDDGENEACADDTHAPPARHTIATPEEA